jgi:cytidylate kinase
MIDFKSEICQDINKVTQYDKPFIITFSGLPECGKTMIARQLSKDLGIFLLSNDYVRNYFYQFTKEYNEEIRKEIERKVKKINLYRLKKLLMTRTSFVYDRDFNIEEQYKILDIIGKLVHMDLIKIKVNSTDEENLKRIKNRNMDYNKIYEGVIGDKVEYLSSYPEEEYYKIKSRKPQMIPDEFFDYVLDSENFCIESLEKSIKYQIRK